MRIATGPISERWPRSSIQTMRNSCETGRKPSSLNNPTDTLSLLKDISQGIASTISYESREEEGTQAPLATLARKRGSCRDFAVLFAEAVRSLGFGARIVSGYLFNPNRLLAGSTDNGSTHAWAEVFIPGAGWITFDPTNRSMGGANLIPVAVTRDIAHAVSVSGSYTGRADACLSMDVAVDVTQITVPL